MYNTKLLSTSSFDLHIICLYYTCREIFNIYLKSELFKIVN